MKVHELMDALRGVNPVLDVRLADWNEGYALPAVATSAKVVTEVVRYSREEIRSTFLLLDAKSL